MTTVLGIETSCDETGVGIARLDPDGTVTLLADEVASSVDEHVGSAAWSPRLPPVRTWRHWVPRCAARWRPPA